MAKILILGGGFGGVVAAERLANELGDQHQITVVSRTSHFVFYPALVRLAFGKCDRDDVSFDLRRTMLNRRVNFIEAEVARIDPSQRKVTIAHGEVEGNLQYDYLVFALGRRLATEEIAGFYEHSHHLLNVDKAIQFGKAISKFHQGRVVFGQCPGARLPVPVYEAAFALSRRLEETGERDKVQITLVNPEPFGPAVADAEMPLALRKALADHHIETIPEFAVERVSAKSVIALNGQSLESDLVMLVPPFRGSPAASNLGITSAEGYINVDRTMRVVGHDHLYAVGDCVNFGGPKMGHMAVRQGEVAAANLVSEISGEKPIAHYVHEMRVVIDEGGSDSIYIYKDLWSKEAGEVRQNRFWKWAKRAQENHWKMAHS